MNETKNDGQADASAPAAKALWDEAKEAVAQVADSASEKIKQELDAQKEKAAERVGGVASALRETSEGLRDAGPLPDLADQAAAQIEKLATYVQSKNLGDLVREVERFARREPAIFLGASFAIGLLGGRFMKASAVPPEAVSTGRSRLQQRNGRRDIEVRPATAMRTAAAGEIEATFDEGLGSASRAKSQASSTTASKSQNGRTGSNGHANSGK